MKITNITKHKIYFIQVEENNVTTTYARMDEGDWSILSGGCILGLTDHKKITLLEILYRSTAAIF